MDKNLEISSGEVAKLPDVETFSTSSLFDLDVFVHLKKIVNREDV